MKSTVLWALVALNAVLLASFAWRLMPDNAAIAQPAAARRVADYLCISGEINGGSSGIIVVLDQSNAMLSALSYDDGNRRLDIMSKIDLRRVFTPGPAAPVGRGAARGQQ